MINSLTLSNVERQEQLLALLVDQQRLTVAQICEQFSISEATARRDLEQLAGQGLLQRVHGGAIAVRRAAPEMPLLLRSHEQADQKSRIGKTAADLIADGEAVFLGSGTTVLEVARNLLERRNLTVITNSLPVINSFAGIPTVQIVAMGGVLRDSELSFIGHITEQALAEVRADKVILGIPAIDVKTGLTNDYMPEVKTDRAIINMAPEIILVADHTKFGQVASAFLAPIDRIQTLVTDEKTDLNIVAQIRELGIKVIIADHRPQGL
jgi:DeoR/GlpR family transcriptional regulator of sugar metabolism